MTCGHSWTLKISWNETRKTQFSKHNSSMYSVYGVIKLLYCHKSENNGSFCKASMALFSLCLSLVDASVSVKLFQLLLEQNCLLFVFVNKWLIKHLFLNYKKWSKSGMCVLYLKTFETPLKKGELGVEQINHLEEAIEYVKVVSQANQGQWLNWENKFFRKMDFQLCSSIGCSRWSSSCSLYSKMSMFWHVLSRNIILKVKKLAITGIVNQKQLLIPNSATAKHSPPAAPATSASDLDLVWMIDLKWAGQNPLPVYLWRLQRVKDRY